MGSSRKVGIVQHSEVLSIHLRSDRGAATPCHRARTLLYPSVPDYHDSNIQANRGSLACCIFGAHCLRVFTLPCVFVRVLRPIQAERLAGYTNFCSLIVVARLCMYRKRILCTPDVRNSSKISFREQPRRTAPARRGPSRAPRRAP